jgi:hypothetical protein
MSLSVCRERLPARSVLLRTSSLEDVGEEILVTIGDAVAGVGS